MKTENVETEQAHTQGKVHVESGTTTFYLISGDKERPHLAKSCGTDVLARANIERLRDCWNALAGLNPSALPEVVNSLEELIQKIEIMRSVRFEGQERPYMTRARAALASLKGAK